MNNDTKTFELVGHKEMAKETGVQLHSVTFSDVYKIESINWREFAERLRKFDPDLQEKTVSFFKVTDFKNRIIFDNIKLWTKIIMLLFSGWS